MLQKRCRNGLFMMLLVKKQSFKEVGDLMSIPEGVQLVERKDNVISKAMFRQYMILPWNFNGSDYSY
jgi:hypothetical protein